MDLCMLRQFPAALKLYDRVLDIMPNDPDMMAAKASIYQAQGNLEEAARSLSRNKLADFYFGCLLRPRSSAKTRTKLR